MEQNKMDRTRFWNNSGIVNEEMMEYLKMIKTERDANFSILDQLFTLLCC